MFHSAFYKDRYWKGSVILLLEMKGLIQIIVKFRAEKIFMYISTTKHPFEGHKIPVMETSVFTWK